MLHQFDSYIDVLSDEVLCSIYQYLQPETLATLAQIDKRAHRVAYDDSLWIPHLRHFRSFLQETDQFHPKFTKQVFADKYEKYFHLLAKMQQDEIEHFLSLETEFVNNNPEHEQLASHFLTLALYKGAKPAKDLAELTNRANKVDSAIDQLNALIIRPVIEEALNNYQDELNLDALKITRIPEAMISDTAYGDFFQNIETLRVSNNPLTRLPCNIHHCNQLKTLNASSTKLTFLPGSIVELSNLNTLCINNNHLLSLPDNIGNLLNLQRMFAAQNHLTDIPDSIADMRQLNAINLKDNQLKCFSLTLPRLMKIGLSGNFIKEVKPQVQQALYNFEQSKIQSLEQVLESQRSEELLTVRTTCR